MVDGREPPARARVCNGTRISSVGTGAGPGLLDVVLLVTNAKTTRNPVPTAMLEYRGYRQLCHHYRCTQSPCQGWKARMKRTTVSS